MANRSNDPFPFMKLPGEIRNQIYRYCLLDRSAVYLTLSKKSRRVVSNIPPITVAGEVIYPKRSKMSKEEKKIREESQPALALLVVSRQIHVEAINFLYQGTLFTFKDASAFRAFMKVIGPGGAWLERICLPTPTHFGSDQVTMKKGMRLLQDAIHLKELQLGVMVKPEGNEYGAREWPLEHFCRWAYEWLCHEQARRGSSNAVANHLQNNFDGPVLSDEDLERRHALDLVRAWPTDVIPDVDDFMGKGSREQNTEQLRDLVLLHASLSML